MQKAKEERNNDFDIKHYREWLEEQPDSIWKEEWERVCNMFLKLKGGKE